jgi:isoleucyl-tRNA synthetase
MGKPPFKTLLTHGFMVDRDGKKLSKSRSDAARYEVDSLCTEFGMDVMRWWVSSLAYENDIKVDLELFALAGESYRKVRNTLRFMLSNLADYTHDAKNDSVGSENRPTSIDAWILGEFAALCRHVIDAFDRYDFQAAHKAIFDFCNTTLSAEYLAAVKDRLYCDRADSPRRRATQATLYRLTEGLCTLLAPIMCHTADEAYRSGFLNRVVADDQLDDEVESLVQTLLAKPKLALLETKAHVNAVTESMVGTGRSWADADGLFAGLRDAEGQESARAYVERLRR